MQHSYLRCSSARASMAASLASALSCMWSDLHVSGESTCSPGTEASQYWCALVHSLLVEMCLTGT